MFNIKSIKLPSTVTRAIGKAGLQAKKYSPEILVGAGIVGMVTSTIMACKATTKAGAITEEAAKQMDQIHEVAQMPDINDYTDEDVKKDTAIVYIQTGVKFAKLYAPSVLLGAVSITSILVGHNILRKRNIALAAAYATIDKSFKDYRGRVIERFGKELDKELKYNIKAQEIEETTTDENGKEKTEKKVKDAANIDYGSDYARFFDEFCKGWSKDAEYNLMFLRRQQDYANDLLKTRGYVFLNDVYDSLGIPRTTAGQQVGWYYDEKNPTGDNYIDFGIYDIDNEKHRDFVNGRERSILLDFNVDGVIMDKLG